MVPQPCGVWLGSPLGQKRGLEQEQSGEPPMKRGTQRAAAPPVVHPPAQPRVPVYRLTHTPVPVGQQPFRQLKVEDALAYLEEVRSALPAAPEATKTA